MAKINGKKGPKRVWFFFDKATKEGWAVNFLGKSDTQYMAARALWYDGYLWESTFFMMQALENLIKSIYIQSTNHKVGINFTNGDFKFSVKGKRSSVPGLYKHSFAPYLGEIELNNPGFRKKIKTRFKMLGKKKAKYLLPTFFEKYQQGSRYPQKKEIGIPFELIHIFDEMFYKVRKYFIFIDSAAKTRSPLQTLLEDIPDPDYPGQFFQNSLVLGDIEKVFRNNKFFLKKA